MIAVILAHSFTIAFAALIAFILGMVWYHPKAFGTLWAGEQPHCKMPEDYQKDSGKLIGASLLDAVFFATMALILFWAYQLAGIILLGLSVTIGIYTNTCAKGGWFPPVCNRCGFSSHTV